MARSLLYDPVMCVWEMLLLSLVTGMGGGAAAFVEPALRGGRLLMVLGASFAAAVAMLFVAGMFQLPQLLPVETVNGSFWLGWAMMGSLGASALIVISVRRHQRSDPMRPSLVP